MDGIRKYIVLIGLILLSSISWSQITTGRIVFERKTNLKKKYGDDDRMKDFITKENKIKVDLFELIFNDTASVFRPIESDEPEEGFMQYMTTHNTTYQNLNTEENLFAFDMWGSIVYMKTTAPSPTWKVTDSKRRIGKYMCRKAIWQKNDSTRIYAWFSVDVVPSIGPEGFNGLPGAILGLATEDGGIIYFAKEIEIKPIKTEVLEYNTKKEEVYTLDGLRTYLTKRFEGKPWGDRVLLDMFRWF